MLGLGWVGGQNIKFPSGNYHTDSSETETLYCLYFSPSNFLQFARAHSTSITFFNFFRMKDLKAEMSQMKQNQTRNNKRH